MRRVRSDSGFTLTELVVVLVLIGFILSIAYSLLHITRVGTTMSNREAWISREVAHPLEFSERVISQLVSIDTASPGISDWRLAFRTQRGGTDTIQRYVIEVPTDPNDHRLLVTLDHGGGSAQAVPWSTANYNRAAGQPLFEFLDSDGVPIENITSTTAMDARAVILTIVTEHEGRRFTDSRTIFLRNR